MGYWTEEFQKKLVMKLYLDSLRGRKSIARRGFLDLSVGMIRGGFLSVSQRMELLALLRSGRAEQRLAQPGRRIKLRFIPAYSPHLNPIERLWGVMHKHLTHNKCYATYREFTEATLEFLRKEVPRRWPEFRDSVTDNFLIIDPKGFRVMPCTGYISKCPANLGISAERWMHK